MGASDLAATLRRLADADVTFPFDCQDRLQELMPELATALERGAAAEAVVEALHGLYEATREISLLHDGERDGYYYAHIEPAFDRAGRELKRSEAVLAAYDALTKAPDV